MMSGQKRESIQVLVCDDDTRRADSWAAQLTELLPAEKYHVQALSTLDFARAVADLHLRVQASKRGEELVRDDAAAIFDHADIIILDSDLTPDLGTELAGEEATAINDHLVGEYGSNVAWLARNFSSAGILVVVNHIFKERTFDLTMMRFAELPADAYISAPDIDSRGLWFGEIDGGFRPWSWPNLVGLARQDYSSDSAQSISEELDRTVCELLDLAPQDVDGKQWERLLFDAETPANITLRDVANSMSYGAGRQADAKLSDSQSIRVARAGLRRWLDRVVIPAQNVFVDYPHLIQDRPWLVSGERRDAEKMTALVADSWESDASPLAEDAYAQFASDLVGRNLWHSNRLPLPESGQRLQEDDLVFCEDVSAFRHIGAAKEYSSDIEGAFRSRFVEQIAGVEYTPKRRLFV